MGVVDDKIWVNVVLRLALCVEDDVDSSDIIDRLDVARIFKMLLGRVFVCFGVGVLIFV